MPFNKFLDVINYQLADLLARNETGVFSAGCEIKAGRPHHTDKRFDQRRVLRREPVEFSKPAAMLQICFKEAQRMECKFFGRIAVEFDIFEGAVVDLRKTIRQTFHCTAGTS
ncbi:MAG: hypothetical protein GY903_01175 [Fuerstiella sp.]|nr:hypothetical protein [Fuerstiella sp.]MCP4853090.1 hypothetical protein [Fuerstiella sp.]